MASARARNASASVSLTHTVICFPRLRLLVRGVAERAFAITEIVVVLSIAGKLAACLSSRTTLPMDLGWTLYVL